MERTFVHTIIVQTEVEFHCISGEIQKNLVSVPLFSSKTVYQVKG